MLLLRRSKFYSVYLAEEERSFYVDLGQKVVKASFCQLLALRQKVQQISLDTLFDPEPGQHDFKIFTFCNNEHLFVLNISEILDLRCLMQNTFAAMGLSKKVVPVTAL